jgi:hypothetical protein
MDLNQVVWELISSRPKIVTEEQKRALHVDIMRAVEQSKTQIGKKHGVTVMTQEASAAGDKSIQEPGNRGNPGMPKPKTV